MAEVDWLSGTTHEITPTAPSAAATEVRPRTRGTEAATSAPKASSRMISVIGSEISSARCRREPISELTAFSSLPGPTSRSVVPGWAASTEATVARTGRTCSLAESGCPASITWTRAVRPPSVVGTGLPA